MLSDQCIFMGAQGYLGPVNIYSATGPIISENFRQIIPQSPLSNIIKISGLIGLFIIPREIQNGSQCLHSASSLAEFPRNTIWHLTSYDLWNRLLICPLRSMRVLEKIWHISTRDYPIVISTKIHARLGQNVAYFRTRLFQIRINIPDKVW